VKGIAVMSAHRVQRSFQIWRPPAKQGLPSVEASVWNAFPAAARAGADSCKSSTKAMSDTLDDPAVRERLEALGLEIAAPERRTPGLSRHIRPRRGRGWGKVVHRRRISAD